RRTGVAFSVAVAALGYFVDLYDIVIFGVVRVVSLNDLGITGADNTAWGIHLLNLQMTGMLIGGVLWGVLGDIVGRRAALLATIGLYSLANIANGFVTSVEQYAVLRFIAGVGLAGELGMGVTLVAELMPARYRGYGTTLIAFMGLLGALAASYIGVLLPWRLAYFAGGGMGLLVMAARWYGLRESEMFTARRAQAHGQGDVRLLFRSAATFGKFLAVIAVGVPIWYISALFVNLAPEYGRALQLTAPLSVAEALRWQAFGLAIGSAATGLLSEWLRSRKRVLYGCFAALIALVGVLLGLDGASVAAYCAVMFAIGLGQGYWTVFITTSAEQFGTNIRATVATSVPNFVRAMIVPITLSLKAIWDTTGLIGGTLLIGALVFGVALLALRSLEETYGKNLDYSE
ncbi:MAG: MFS transporter, partial [Nevskiaceae bacterium]